MTLRIRKILLIGLLIGFNFLAINFMFLENQLKKPSYNYLQSVTVQITSNERIIGTGVIVKIDENCTYILTNSHLAREGEEIYVRNERKHIKVIEVKRDNLFDLVLVKIKGKLKTKVAIKGIAFAKPQDNVFSVGIDSIYSEGVFVGYSGVREIIQIPTIYGNSGSGIFNKDGKLVSLIFRLYIGDTTRGIAISGINIEKFLREVGVYD